LAAATPQRSYRAPCPGCGAPVEFRSAQSTHAVCSFCRSTVVRSGETLSRVGKMAELFDDHSPLQLLATGTWDGRGFTLVGCLQYRGGSGAWTEWEALFADGSAASLAEDNGSYVLAWPAPFGREPPPPERFRLGATTAVSGKPFSVTAIEQAVLVSAQGELPKLPPLGQPFAVVELRSADGEVLAIDYGVSPPQVSRGRQVRLEDLRMAGLREEVAREEKGRQLTCPHCGAPIEVRLEGTRSITCATCNAIVDLDQGLGGELRHAVQDEPVQPLIPLGSSGQLQGTTWQVVGFQHRLGRDPADEDDEHFGWSEYLLYNRHRGFLFLVDATDGWSLYRTATGAPQLSPGGQTATYLGTQYRLQASYHSETSYVAGEFYWPVRRGQRTNHREFASGRSLLSMEQAGTEVTWSTGSAIASDTVAAAFGQSTRKDLFRRGDAGPTTPAGSGMGCGCAVILLILLLILVIVVIASARRAGDDRDPSSSYGTRGGSWGGYSSGGGHK
jgi:endogenous inhibitor of DNA gyrase (YacG/DUF329 family)